MKYKFVFTILIVLNIIPSFSTFTQFEEYNGNVPRLSSIEHIQIDQMAETIGQIVASIPDFANPGQYLDATKASEPPYIRKITKSEDKIVIDYNIDNEIPLYHQYKEKFDLHFPLTFHFQKCDSKDNFNTMFFYYNKVVSE